MEEREEWLKKEINDINATKGNTEIVLSHL